MVDVDFVIQFLKLLRDGDALDTSSLVCYHDEGQVLALYSIDSGDGIAMCE